MKSSDLLREPVHSSNAGLGRAVDLGLGLSVRYADQPKSSISMNPGRGRSLQYGRCWDHVARTLATVFLVCSLASAQTLTGTLNNGTTKKPAAGDEVVLLSLAQGMQEAGRSKTDAKGNFTLKLDNAGPHLIRAIHQGVTYHRMAPPGTTSVALDVYDVSKRVEGISVTADVMRLQAQGNELHGIRVFAVNNASNPPHTQMSDQNFEFYLPDGAQVDQAMAMTAGGQPVNSSAVPGKEKNRYAFVFPLRPGMTQLQVAFHMPYGGQAHMDPRALYGAQHFVVLLPKTMQFAAGPGTGFQPVEDPQQSDAVVQVASNTTVGQPLDFSISGSGTLSAMDGAEGNSTRGSGGPQSRAAGRDSRPGGGLGPPIDAPDPLEKHSRYILGAFGILLAAGAIFVVRRSNSASVHDSPPSEVEAVPISLHAKPKLAASMLLEALKEETFQLEVEHKQGRVSQPEYEQAKAALSQTLDRALKRAAMHG